MLFKSLTAYAAHPDFTLDAATLAAALATRPFVPCGPLQVESVGWVSPYEDDRLLVSLEGQHLAFLQIERKKLSAALVKEKLAQRVAELETAQGYAVGRKQKREMKEALIDELLPEVPPKRVTMRVWIDTVNKTIAVNSASTGAAESVLKQLSLATDIYPAAPLATQRPGLTVAKDWLLEGEATDNLELGFACELRLGESGASVKYAKHSLDTDDVKKHLSEGKEVVSVALSWDETLTFTLVENQAAIQLKKLDFVVTDAAREDGEDKAARLEGELLLESGALSRLFKDLVSAFGGRLVETEAD